MGMLKSKIRWAVGLGSSLALVAGPVVAATSDVVTATVTPQVISVSVSDGTVDYGILGFGESNDTKDGTASETQTVTNDSNVRVDISVKSSDATGTSVAWELGGTAGSDVFEHSYAVDAGAFASFPTDNSFSSSNVSLDESGGIDTRADLDLKLAMPTDSTDTSQHSVDVTVLATES